MDKNEASFLPNLERAYSFRTKMMDESLEMNIILSYIEKNPDWFHFGRRPWKKITQISEIQFPSISFNADQADTYNYLQPNHVFNFRKLRNLIIFIYFN